MEIWRRFTQLWPPTQETLIQVVDVLLVAFIAYKLLVLVRSTRAWRILVGIIVFIVALVLSEVFQLRTVHWLLEKATLLGPVALVILFLPELRQTLEGFGKLGDFTDRPFAKERAVSSTTLEEIVAAVAELSSTKTGALIVVERGVHLDDIIATGVSLNAAVSAALFGSIFYDQGPLHDGATVVRGNVISAAACRLPLSENARIDSHLHMRHRAGIGITEQSDSICIIVSEERGIISFAVDGRLERLPDTQALRDRLKKELLGDDQTPKKPRRRRKEEVVA
ncbi:MAG: diadenylate cyclase CdaA [Armatimonadetes bacterium]|nr:diadenylate cyclase CdaA [Armatimonadota bacterium]